MTKLIRRLTYAAYQFIFNNIVNLKLLSTILPTGIILTIL